MNDRSLVATSWIKFKDDSFSLKELNWWDELLTSYYPDELYSEILLEIRIKMGADLIKYAERATDLLPSVVFTEELINRLDEFSKFTEVLIWEGFKRLTDAGYVLCDLHRIFYGYLIYLTFHYAGEGSPRMSEFFCMLTQFNSRN